MKLWRDVRPVLTPFLAANPRQLALGAVLAAMTVLMGMALLGLSGWFITATALAGLQAATAIRFDVFMPSAGIRLLALGRTASRYGERLVTHDATFGVLAALRERLFRGWAEPGAARQLLARPARLLFRLTADIDALESFYLRMLVPAGATLGAATLAGVVLGAMRPWMGLVLALWLVAAGWGIALAVASRARPAAVRRAQAMEALRARAVDLVAGQTELVMAGRIDAQRESLAAADRHLAQADLALNRLDVGAGMAYGMAGTLTLAAVLLAVSALAGEGAIGAPAAALALLVALTAVEPFAALRRGALEAGRAWLAARRLAPRMATQRPHASQPARASDDRDALRLTRVSAAHPGSRVAALHDISMTLAEGERVALIGPSGAGKSTLLAVLAGDLALRSGEVSVWSSLPVDATHRTFPGQSSRQPAIGQSRRRRCATPGRAIGSGPWARSANHDLGTRHLARGRRPGPLGRAIPPIGAGSAAAARCTHLAAGRTHGGVGHCDGARCVAAPRCRGRRTHLVGCDPPAARGRARGPPGLHAGRPDRGRPPARHAGIRCGIECAQARLSPNATQEHKNTKGTPWTSISSLSHDCSSR